MKKMRIDVRILLLITGLITHFYLTPVFAQMNISKPSKALGEPEVNRHLSVSEANAFFDIVEAAMKLLRDDNADEANAAFGARYASEGEAGAPGYRYLYKSLALPQADIELYTGADPLDYSDDRSSVAVVPLSFRLRFKASIYGIDRNILMQRLALESYWVDSDDIRHHGNSLPSFPPTPQLHTYRYRAREILESRFPVDVELYFIDPLNGDSNQDSRLDEVLIYRAYPFLTPAMRKQKRDEAAARANAAYGKSRGGEQ
ncbi:hypothetical protein G3N59_07905 [Paraburkholderia sp. Ac-20340]|uniref:hypothetical protein n=1 Tax=Paraburkholderia sp. Ac-20340 TaxID=2703888 RepID=UPI001981189E|nr:hypothetical protein [Paraburkholderia sp. Ac-20340]MBN3853296.1 hypothetical protein [Paraburkholderia sp. Ac-20340]